MTREKAIKLLKEYALRVKPFYEPQRTEYTKAIDMAIEALSKDISEDGTLKVNVKDGSKVNRVLVCGDNNFGGLYYPDRPEGEWIESFDGNEWTWYCTNCKTEYYQEDLFMGGSEFPRFCPNCGADMMTKESEE